MESHVIPFENRWTNGKHAWEWHCELERLGVPTVRTMYSEHETHITTSRPSCSTSLRASFETGWPSTTGAPPGSNGCGAPASSPSASSLPRASCSAR